VSITVRQAVSKKYTTGATQGPDWAEDTLAGSYLIACVCYSGTPAVTITTDEPNFTFVNQNTIAGAGGLTARYYHWPNAPIRVSGTNRPTIVFSSAPNSLWFILELTGAATASPIDVSAFTSQASSTSLVSGNLATVLANDFVLGFLFNRNVDAQTPSGSSLALDGVTGDSNPVASSASNGISGGAYVVSGGTVTPGTYGLAATIGTTRNWVGIGVAIKDALGADLPLGGAPTSIFVRPSIKNLSVSGANTDAFNPDRRVWRWPPELSGQLDETPIPTILAATSIASTGAILNASVDARGVETSVVFDYGSGVDTNGDPVYSGSTTPITIPAAFGGQPVAAPVVGLLSSTNYSARVRATNANGTATSTFTSFATLGGGGPGPSGPPVVLSGPSVVGVPTQTSITITATVDQNGAGGLVHLERLVGATWTEFFQDASGSTSVVTVTGPSLGLSAGTSYQFRVRATNANSPEPGGTIGGPITVSTAIATTAPVPSLLAIGTRTQTTAVVNGRIDSIVGVPAKWQFEWGLTTAYGNVLALHTDGAIPPGGVENVTDTITGLTAGTTYHYRLNATRTDDVGGVQHSLDDSFTTLASGAIVLPNPTTSDATSVTQTTVTLNGSITMIPS
jgi:hypothetical protein